MGLTPDLAFSMDWSQQVCPSFLSHLDTEQTHLDALFYDIYTHVSDCHLSEVGADVQWHDVDVGRLDGAEDDERWGGTRKYFTLPIYRLPIAQLKGD